MKMKEGKKEKEKGAGYCEKHRPLGEILFLK